MKKSRIVDENVTEEDIKNHTEEEISVYRPEEVDEDSLSYEEEAYVFIDYISLDWPSQTVDCFNSNNVVIGTNPNEGDGKIVSFDLEDFKGSKDGDKLKHNEKTIPKPLNRIRCKNAIYGVSDDGFYIYNFDLETLHSKDMVEGAGYGLCTTEDGAYFSSMEGMVYKINDKGLDTFKVHKGSIESLSFGNNLLFSCSTDRSAKVTDVRSRDVVFDKKYACDINAIDFNQENIFVFGDDAGLLRVVDLRSLDTCINIDWHKTSISSVRWKDSDVFISSSDQQVCIFDLTLEEDWTYEKYLLFVHQGQKFYKDMCFTSSDSVVTTSIDGLCLFKPISFEE
ncbi:Glutamate-rich WD repeat-containing protein 1 [Nosema granulosis]|uniref:Glutamate-rich WD repeat-containing protein 1 n=1 Tax=Nosema granulosis TaxID=83296 RepID=A0A9P6KZZ3_9MICR|nr:Glutamate-rich WD repeat-containing protein 1 [Nosema granulosis]